MNVIPKIKNKKLKSILSSFIKLNLIISHEFK